MTLSNFSEKLPKTPHQFVVELLKLPWPKREQLKVDVGLFFVEDIEEEFLELGGHRSALHHLVRKYSSVTQQEGYSKQLRTLYPDCEELQAWVKQFPEHEEASDEDSVSQVSQKKKQGPSTRATSKKIKKDNKTKKQLVLANKTQK